MSDRAIPRSWNDRVLWLLEHLIGLDASAANGLSLALGAPASEAVHYVRVSYTAGAPATTSTETAIQMPSPGPRSWRLLAAHVVRTAGTGSTFAPRIGQAAAFVAGGIDQRVAYAAQPVGTPIDDVFCAPIPMRADPLGRLYLRPEFDAGADNVAIFDLWFVQAVETPESTQ